MSRSDAFAELNWWAVIVAWIMHVVVGFVWFRPVFFGKAWTRLSGKELAPAVPRIPAGLAAHFVCVLALAAIVRLAGATTVLEGVVVGAFASVCFSGAVLAGELVWEKIPFRLFPIRLDDQVITAGMAGAVLAAWRWRAALVSLPAPRPSTRPDNGIAPRPSAIDRRQRGGAAHAKHVRHVRAPA